MKAALRARIAFADWQAATARTLLFMCAGWLARAKIRGTALRSTAKPEAQVLKPDFAVHNHRPSR
jgi:hypothetical protein